jgi:serine/threonine protein kinase
MTKDLLDLVGSVLDERFHVDAIVDEGELSFTYKGHDLKHDKLVAIRCLNVPTTLDPALADPFIKSFRERVRLHARLAPGNTNFVQAIANGTTVARTTRREVPYEIREWLDGSTFAAYAAKRRAEKGGPWPIDFVLALLTPVASGLSYLHARGLVHGEINPNNLLVLDASGNPTVKLVDVGEGRVANDKKDERPVLRVLLPEYTAPEQVDKQAGPVGAWTDVFSFAVIVLECLAGGLGTEGVAAVVLIDPENRPSTKKLRLSLPRRVQDVLDRALSVNPTARPPNATAFWRELQEAVAPAEAPSSGPISSTLELPDRPLNPFSKGTLLGIQPTGSLEESNTAVEIPMPPPASHRTEDTPTRRLESPADSLEDSTEAQPFFPVAREPSRADLPLAGTGAAPEASEPSVFMPALGRPPLALRLRLAARHAPKAVAARWARVRSWTKGRAWPWLVARVSDRAPRARVILAGSVFGGLLLLALLVEVAFAVVHKRTDGQPLAQGAPSASAAASGPMTEHPATAAPSVAEPASAPVELEEPPSAPQPQTPPAALAGFSRVAAGAALAAAGGDLTECRALGGLRGSGSIRATFDKKGSVARIRIGPPYADTPEGVCILNRFSRAQTAPFHGPAGTVNYTFALPP